MSYLVLSSTCGVSIVQARCYVCSTRSVEIFITVYYKTKLCSTTADDLVIDRPRCDSLLQGQTLHTFPCSRHKYFSNYAIKIARIQDKQNARVFYFNGEKTRISVKYNLILYRYLIFVIIKIYLYCIKVKQ